MCGNWLGASFRGLDFHWFISGDGLGPILIVDDDETICNVIRDALVSEGFTARTAASASAAIYATPVPRLVILDLNLAEYPGEIIIEALFRVSGRQIPIVAISADPHAHERLRGQAGVVAFLAKPFDLDQLVEICHALVPEGDTGDDPTTPASSDPWPPSSASGSPRP